MAFGTWCGWFGESMRYLQCFLSSITGLYRDFAIPRGGGVLVSSEYAGDWRVKALRLWNLLEPLIILGLFVGGMKLGDDKVIARETVRHILIGCAVWGLLISPLVHYPFEKRYFLTEEERKRGFSYYFFECRGLGNPLRYFWSPEGPGFIRYWREIVAVALMFVGLFICSYIYNETHHVKPREGWYSFGSIAQGLFLSPRGIVYLWFGVVLIMFPLLVRWDNLRESARMSVAFGIPMLVFVWVCIFTLMCIEDSLRPMLAPYRNFALEKETGMLRYMNFEFLRILAQTAGYSLCGFAQQLGICAFFGVYFARAFDVSGSRFQLFLACLLSGASFGISHFPNFWLGMFTFVAGCAGTPFFLRSRNTFAFGVVHGVMGSFGFQLMPISFHASMPGYF